METPTLPKVQVGNAMVGDDVSAALGRNEFGALPALPTEHVVAGLYPVSLPIDRVTGLEGALVGATVPPRHPFAGEPHRPDDSPGENYRG